MTMTETDPNTAHRLAIAIQPAVRALLLCMAHCELMRSMVLPIDTEVLTGMNAATPDGRPVRTTERSWLLSDADFKRYIELRTAKLAAAGLGKHADLADGQCPLLVAQHLEAAAENLLLDAAATVVPPMGGMKTTRPDLRKRGIDLLLRMGMAHPSFRHPLDARTMGVRP
jgi:hypothetical protein